MGLIQRLLDALAPSRVEARQLRLKNDQLAASNNRLGKTILELRQRIQLGEPKSALRKALLEAQAALQEARYTHHVNAQRQHLLVKRLRTAMPENIFVLHCNVVNAMTDQEVLATTQPKDQPTSSQKKRSKP